MVQRAFLCVVLGLCSGCQSQRPDMLKQATIQPRIGTCRWDQKFNSVGKLFGNVAILSSKAAVAPNHTIRQNIWTTTMQILHDFSFEKVDPDAGIIETPWFDLPKKPGQRFKICCTIASGQDWVRSVQVRVDHQISVKGSAKGQWQKQPARTDLAFYIKDSILTTARKSYACALPDQPPRTAKNILMNK